MLELICLIIFIFGCVPFLVTMFTLLKNFIIRTEKYYPNLYHRLSISRGVLKEELSTSGRVEFGFVVFFSVLDVVVSLTVALALHLLGQRVEEQTILLGTLVTISLVTLPFLLRFICDIIKGTKLNNQTGELERIQQLESRIKELEKGK